MAELTVSLNDLRSQLKTASTVRDSLISIYQHLQDEQVRVRDLDPTAIGVQDLLDLISSALEVVLTNNNDLIEEEHRVHTQLEQKMKG